MVAEVKNDDLPPGVEVMPCDFFHPQPVKNAKAYLLRIVLHNWSDKQAWQILANVRAAVSKDSILLINESTLPESNVPLTATQLDLSMMAIFASLDRTATQLTELLESSGFRLVKM